MKKSRYSLEEIVLNLHKIEIALQKEGHYKIYIENLVLLNKVIIDGKKNTAEEKIMA